MTGPAAFSYSKLRDLGRNRSLGVHADICRTASAEPFLPPVTNDSASIDAIPTWPDSGARATPASPPATSSQQQPSAENGTFVIRKDVDEVLLHATVVDDKQHIVTDLDRSAFSVFEDGKPQTIISFRHEDIPVSMGIVIDNSGSMREKRAKVNQAALNLVRASNPQDEVFVVNFNDEYLSRPGLHQRSSETQRSIGED